LKGELKKMLRTKEVLKKAEDLYMKGKLNDAFNLLRNQTKDLEFVLGCVLRDLPQKRDWLAPDIEKWAKQLIGDSID
jgi:hypothetical protein